MAVPILQIPIQSETVHPYIKQGDTIPKISLSIPELDLSGASIKMKLYSPDGVRKVLDISNGNGITIINSTNFEIDEITAANNTLPAGQLKGDLEITLQDETKKTFCDVEYTIIKDYT